MGLFSRFTGWFGRQRASQEKSGRGFIVDGLPTKVPPGAAGLSQIAVPRFRATAGDQLGAQESATSRKRMRLLESFTPSQPISDRRRFAGRTEVLGSIISAIEEQRLHVVVYGERGLGKTSVMHVLTQAAREARYLVVYVSCGADSSFDEIFRTVAAHIPMLFHSAVGPTSPDVEKGKTLADSLSPATISPRVASDILAKVVGTRVVVVLDEFDRANSQEFRRNVAELIKNLSDRLVRVQLVIAGVGANLTELIEHVPSIQRNIFALQVPWMSPAEVRLLIKNGGELSDLLFDAAAEDAIVSAAHGSPYLATLLSHHAGLKALDEQRIRVSSANVLAAISAAAQEYYGRMSGRTRSQLKTYSGRFDVLGVIVGASLLSNGSFRKEDLWSSSSGPDASYDVVIKELVDADLLNRVARDEGIAYTFPEDGITTYLWLLSVEAKLQANERPAQLNMKVPMTPQGIRT